MSKMTEPEVILGVSKYLQDNKFTEGKITISLDGEHLKIFPYSTFIEKNNLNVAPASSGSGDIQATFCDEIMLKTGKKKILIECKKGLLEKSSNSGEYKLIREALGQLLTRTSLDKDTLYAIAVPKSEKTVELAMKWSESQGVKILNFKILLIDKEYNVYGLFDNCYE